MQLSALGQALCEVDIPSEIVLISVRTGGGEQ